MGKIATGVSLTPENHAFAKASGDISKTLNDVLDKVRSGQWMDAAAVKEGQQALGCIYNMPDSKELDMKCPVKINHPDLAEKSRLGDLLTCCRQCPRKAEYLHMIKKRGQPAPPPEQVTTETGKPKTFICKNGCGVTLQWGQTQKGWVPIETATGILHVCPAYQKKQEPQQPQEKYEESRHVICSSCKERFGTFMTDPEALDRLLDTVMQHTKGKHGREMLTEDETRQFRQLREVKQA